MAAASPLQSKTVGELIVELGHYGGPWTLWREGDVKEVQEAIIVGRIEDSELGYADA